MSSGEKIIAVVGATGNQGNSVANTFLTLPNWKVRCLTRNPSSDKAKDLAFRGAEVVQADLVDPESLAKAFDGVHAIFLNTDFWAMWRPLKAKLDAEGKSHEAASEEAFRVETTHGKNAVDAAVAVPGLERLVVSALPSISKASGGKFFRSRHCEAKAWIVDYIAEKHPELNAKTSIIYLGAYDDNRMLQPRLNEEKGRYEFVLPALKAETKMPIIITKEATGPFVQALIEDESAGTKLLAYNSNLTIGQIVDEWSKASVDNGGKEAMFVPISVEVARGFGMTDEHLDSPAFVAEFGYVGLMEGVVEPGQLKKTVVTKTWEESLREEK